jgi:hypothetical protein
MRVKATEILREVGGVCHDEVESFHVLVLAFWEHLEHFIQHDIHTVRFQPIQVSFQREIYGVSRFQISTTISVFVYTANCLVDKTVKGILNIQLKFWLQFHDNTDILQLLFYLYSRASLIRTLWFPGKLYGSLKLPDI